MMPAMLIAVAMVEGTSNGQAMAPDMAPAMLPAMTMLVAVSSQWRYGMWS